MKCRLTLVLVAVACSAGESERTRSQSERRQSREALLSSDVVQSAKTPSGAGRLIYDPLVTLSKDSSSLKVLAPDSTRKRP